MTELEFLSRQHQEGRIGRRALLGRAAALGAGAALLAGMVASIDAQAAETPRQGGALRLGLGGGSTTDSCDPTSYTDSVMIDASRALFNGLVEWGQDGKPVPELAEALEARTGAAEWVLTLKKGVTFSNGKTFDADDAIYSINLHRGQSKSGAAGAFKAVKEVRKLTDSQIQVTLDSADADFAYVLTDSHMLVVPNGFADWSRPVGTGPFVLDRFEPGVRFVARRRAGYWKPNRGHLDAIDITVINDTSARLNALMAGQVDAINRLDPKLAPIVQKNPKLDVVRAASGWHTVVSMMRDKPPFDNIDLRLAFKWGIDREQIVRTLFAGFGSVGNDQPIPKTDPYYNPTLPQFHFDVERAKFHLKKAGGAPAITIQASDAAFNGAVDMAMLMQASAAKAGLKIDVKQEPADGFWDNVWLKGPCVTGYWAGRAAATQMLSVAYGPDAPWNESHFKTPRFTALLAAARAELDEAKRRAMIWELQTILHDDGATIVPAFRDWVDAHNKNVGGHTPHGGLDMDDGLIADKAWLKA